MLSGVFPSFVRSLIVSTCGECTGISSNYTTRVDYISNGKGAFARKRNIDRVLDDIDANTHIAFPLTTAPVDSSNAAEFAILIKYPGAMYIVRKPSVKDQVEAMLVKLLETLPLFLINILMMMVAGTVVFLLVRIGSLTTNEIIS